MDDGNRLDGRGMTLLRRIMAGGGHDPHGAGLAPGTRSGSGVAPAGGDQADQVVTGSDPGRTPAGGDQADQPPTRPGAGRTPAGGDQADQPPGPLRHVAHLPARPGREVAWPQWVAPQVRVAFEGIGVGFPWSHQVQGADLVRVGRDVVVATGTASGKSLVYQLPVLSRLTEDPRATALYLAPTKALAGDQVRSVEALHLPEARVATVDGDSSRDERDWARRYARWVFSNPDMLHRSLLPRHSRWASLLRRLEFVVLDECHAYRGVFGSHVALLLRRLTRLCARYGAAPVFVLASATVAEPARFASLLTGREIVAVTADGSPAPARTVALWEPPLRAEVTGENGAPVRRAAGSESARMLADLVVEGARTLAFVRSRRGAETVALGARRLLAEAAPELVSRVASYRGGYLPEERRSVEAALTGGRLTGVATTSALELGMDISGLDAVVMAGFPGTRASFWQQAGRAGRGRDDALVILVARDDPLDTYLVHHPQALLEAPVEGCVLDPTNPYVLGPQLACAAAELPIADAEVAGLFGGAPAAAVLGELVVDGVLRRRSTGWFWPATGEHPTAAVDIRGSGLGQVAVVESATGRMLGTVDGPSAPATVHPGAVYLHQGESHLVEELDLDAGVALVRVEAPDWRTDARSIAEVRIDAALTSARHGPVTVSFGDVEVTTQVVAYQRRSPEGTVLATVLLDLPASTLRTRAVWFEVEAAALAAGGLAAPRVAGALHAAEHAAIGMLPLFAMCDRWDIGGLSTALHPQTGRPTVLVHDGHPGGAGFAERGHRVIRSWLAATRQAIGDCECRTGCPSCVQSPKCGNGNVPLDKAGARTVLGVVLGALGEAGDGAEGESEPQHSGKR